MTNRMAAQSIGAGIARKQHLLSINSTLSDYQLLTDAAIAAPHHRHQFPAR